jgi:hypothetical protein
MDDPLRVRDGERLGDARDHLHALAHGQADAREALAERLTDDPLHGEERHAVLGLAVGDVLDDAGVAQLLEDARFAIEALLVLAGVTPVEDLDRDDAAATQIGGAEDGRHAARADAALDLEALRDGGSGLDQTARS